MAAAAATTTTTKPAYKIEAEKMKSKAHESNCALYIQVPEMPGDVFADLIYGARERLKLDTASNILHHDGKDWAIIFFKTHDHAITFWSTLKAISIAKLRGWVADTAIGPHAIEDAQPVGAKEKYAKQTLYISWAMNNNQIYHLERKAAEAAAGTTETSTKSASKTKNQSKRKKVTAEGTSALQHLVPKPALPPNQVKDPSPPPTPKVVPAPAPAPQQTPPPATDPVVRNAPQGGTYAGVDTPLAPSFLALPMESRGVTPKYVSSLFPPPAMSYSQPAVYPTTLGGDRTYEIEIRSKYNGHLSTYSLTEQQYSKLSHFISFI